MRKIILAILLFLGVTLTAQNEYKFNTKPNGFSVGSRSNTSTTIVHNVNAITLEEADREGLNGQYITLAGIHVANEAGAPDLPSGSTFVAIPNGSTPSITMVNAKTKTIKNVNLIPAPQPQLDDDNSPAVYQKNMDIYSRNAFYPAQPYNVSEVMTVRGVEMVQVGVMPFQYNPVTKELIVYEDLELKLTTEGGDNTYGDLRYRTPEWDQILSDMLLNREVLPKVDYGERLRKHYENRETGCEYVIITPDNDEFTRLADSIKQFRSNQGIPTEIFTVSECGGNTGQAIRNFIRNAYNEWDMPPAAVLILGDHDSNPEKGVVSFTMNNHPGGDGYNPYISDHRYAVMNNGHMPEIILGRITGRNPEELYHMIKKDLDYERTPPTNPDFYDKPITAMGYQLERWFQLCSEVVYGFWEQELGKHPVRINAIYQGTPGSRWSTYENTNAVLNYFGPNGCGYIPQNMSHLTDWSGTGDKVNNAINSGAFLLQHRDHGAEELWGEPSYSIGYIKRLTNKDLTYVMSNNCLTGRFNYNGVNGDGCFAEVFHRHQHGAVGLIAATQVSYSFVNDVYVWGAYDNMWPDFLPTYGTEHATNFILPAFGNAAGKYFLRQSSWTDDYVKEITYYLFHQHGDAYMNLYSEIPQQLTVDMLPVLMAGSNQYQIKVDEGATICLTANGQVIGFDYGTGDVQTITVTPQEVGTRIKLTIRKQNYYRYEHELATIPEGEPYLIFHSVDINDAEGNNNHEADYNETCRLNVSLHNVGATDISQVNTSISCKHHDVQILQNDASYGTVNGNGILLVNDAFTIHFGDAFNDGERIRFYLHMDNGSKSFVDSVDIRVNAPNFRYDGVTLSTLNGDSTDRLMPGNSTLMTYHITNTGHSRSLEQTHRLSIKAPFLTIAENSLSLPAIEAGETSQVTFQVDASNNHPEGNLISFTIQAESGYHTAYFSHQTPYSNTIEDFDDNSLNPNIKWDLGNGSKVWYITEDETANGGHCLHSPTIENNKQADLLILFTCHTDTTFSFRHKTVTDTGDRLTLYLNNHETASWSGESDWETSTFKLKDGKNLIKFTFKRDATSHAADSCVLLDHFMFPPMENLILFAGDDRTVCPSLPFTPNSYACHQEALLWSTEGDGNFDDPTLEHPVYTFGPNDIDNRQVVLTLTGTSATNQQQESTQVNIHLTEDITSIQNIESAFGDTLVDLYQTSQSEYYTNLEISGDYLWQLDPEQAGTLTFQGNHATVHWDDNYRGNAYISYRLSNECGESDRSETLTVRVTNSTSVDETNGNSTLEVYPNPASERIVIKINELQSNQIVIRIIDPLGRTVLTTQKNVEGTTLNETLNTTALRNGLYDVQVIDASHIHSRRVIIK